MNNTFNPGRFNLLLKKHFIDSWKWLVLSYGLIAVVIAIVLLFVARVEGSIYITQDQFDNSIKEALMSTSAIFAYLFSALAAGSATKTMRNRSTRLPYLMIPASQFEKFLASVVFAVPLFIIGYTLAMYLGQIFASILYPAFFWNSEHHISISNWLCDIFTTQGSSLKWALFTLLANQSIYFLGGIVWGKNPFFKTTGVLAALIFICSQLGVAVGFIIFANSNFLLDDDVFSEETISAIFTVCSWIFIIFNYSVAYLRLKELEIINRW